MNYNTPLPPFKWFILENFPYIEDDFDALTNWQLFCKLGKEMNKIIEKCNLTGAQVEQLTNAFNSLQNYVNNYFENLDVQEEINTKLDEMAESGELTDIIAQYLGLAGVLAYDTKTAMKQAENLVEGSITKTLGNTSYTDGQGAFYKVRQVQNTDVIDNENIIALHDPDLVAEKILYSSGYDLHNEIEETEETLQDQIDFINEGQVIFISDSYGAGYTPDSSDRTSFIDYFKTYTKLGNDKVYSNTGGGTGFYATYEDKNFTTLLEELDSTITNKDLIKKIYVVGGYNDQAETYSNIWSGIQAFFTYANTNYPNATIYVGFVGYDIRISQSGTREAIYTKGIPAYKKCIELGGIYLNNIDYILHNPRFMSSDSVHPNTEGQQQLGRYLSCNYKNVGYDPQRLSLTSGKINPTKYNLSLSNLEDSYIEIGKLVNNNVTTYSVKMELNSTVAFNISATKLNISALSTITNNEINQAQFDSGSLNKVIKTRVSSNSTFYDYNAVLEFDGSNLSIRFYQSIPNVTSIFIPYQEFELPSILC